ncbi:MAG: 16S rRNA (guanine(527)-N(7))-methyltransferase RsmG [Gammaproteobacteria bacterium]|nr:16S rRNA (guanine(527)-N(7))-methyltransferase RsmG [Gammaproteobacteria bacterium]
MQQNFIFNYMMTWYNCLMGSQKSSVSRLLTKGCSHLGLDLSKSQLRALEMHIEYITKWNQRVNLTSILDFEQMVVRHILDSLAILPYVRGSRLLDIGSGGGFPGVPIAITHTGIEIVLLDSNKKKTEFLGHVKTQLKLSNVSVIHERIENYRPVETVHTLTARAVGSIQRVLGQVQSLGHPSTRLLVMKGKNPESEIQDLILDRDQDISIVELDVPYLNADRNLVVIEF